MSPARSLSAAGLAALFVLAPAFNSPVFASSQSEFVPGELLVGFRTGARLSVPAGRVMGSHRGLSAVRVKVDAGKSLDAAAAELRRNPDVLYVEPNYIRRTTAAPNDPYFQFSQYGPQKIKADRAWDNWKPQAKVTIAIVDTGIEYAHNDLKNVLVRDASNNVVGYNALTRTSNANDDHGHGTHVAGIAAAQINNALGTAGVAGWNPSQADSGSFVRLLPVKALDVNGSGTDSSISDGITWAADHGARVINLSLGGPSYSNTINSAVQYAWNKGAVVVAAAGNDSVSTTFYPAGCPNVISVAATDATDTLSYFSNHGSWVKTAAPGSAILSTYKGSTGKLSGTSMASPHVAGEAAILMAHAPSQTNAQISTLITSNVDAYTPYLGRSIKSGAGRVNIEKALQALSGGSYSVSASAVALTTGQSFTASWAAPAGRPSTDWIGLYKVGDPNTVYGWWSFTNGSGAGSAAAVAPGVAGTYELRYLLSGGYTDSARSAAITVQAPAASYSIAASTAAVTAGGALNVSWTAPAGRPVNDWIGLFKVGDPNTAYGWWKYTNGAASGTLALTAPTAAGSYEFRYLLNNGYTDSARSGSVRVDPPAGNYSLTVNSGTVASGASITVSWTAPGSRPYNDWIGIFKVGDPNTAYGWWKYTGGATAGSFTLPAPTVPGQYEFRYLLENGFTDSARSAPITVGP